MDNQARVIGRRVRYWRQRRNLDRKQFADMVDRSTSWLDKIEKGERNLLRLPMLDRVAEVLGIEPTALTDAPTARRHAQCVDTVEVQTIRDALSRYPSLSLKGGGQEPSLDQVTKQLRYVDQAWLSSHFVVVMRHLPKLLHEAQILTLSARPSSQVAASRTLVMAYRLASSVLLKFEANDVAWLAADRAMLTATSVDDTLALARASRSMLFLAASITAAKQEDSETALLMHQQAHAAAEELGPHYKSHHTAFGHANVNLHRVAALVRLHESGRALEYAECIDPTSITVLPPERRVNYMLDLTTAYAQVGKHPEAVRALVEAERIAPEEVRCRPLAHGLLRAMLRNTSGDVGRSVLQMATRAGVSV